MTLPLLRSGRNAATLADARAAIAAHGRAFAALEAHALRQAAAGAHVEAAAWAQMAYQYGWAMPTGALLAPALEAMLNEIGRVHVPGNGEPPRSTGDPQRVLHVMTECYDVGGHTRVVRRWVENDHRASTVLLTGQRGPIPAALLETLEQRGARLVPSLPAGDLLGRARALRGLAAEHDLVVLHVHMHDVLPALAFADPLCRPPTIFFEHAAHQLWVGAGAADILACFREVEFELAGRRRGFDPDRTVLLPLPASPPALPPRPDARARLGIAADQPVILTVASPWKVRPVLEPSFQDLAAAALEAAPDAILLVAGPHPDAGWSAAVDRSGGRLRLLGPVPDLAPLLAAADLYLDSWPASGGTTVLDVAAAGLPIVSLGDGGRELGMIRPTEPLLEAGVVHALTTEEVGEQVAGLLASPERRREMADALRAGIEAGHAGGWGERLEAAVRSASDHAGAATPPQAVPDLPPEDWECVLQLLLGAEHGLSPHSAVAIHVGELPPEARPQDADAVIALVNGVLTAADRPRRAVGAPELELSSVVTLVERMRGLHEEGAVESCVVAIPPDHLDHGLELLQAALDRGGDLDIDVVPAASLGALGAGPGDLVLT